MLIFKKPDYEYVALSSPPISFLPQVKALRAPPQTQQQTPHNRCVWFPSLGEQVKLYWFPIVVVMNYHTWSSVELCKCIHCRPVHQFKFVSPG